MSVAATAAASTPKKPVKKLAGERVGIPPRQVHFPLKKEMNRYFMANNSVATQFMATLSGAFPPGEDFFVQSVKNFRGHIKDKTLRDQVSGFIGQEALHGREHERLNELLKQRGINTDFPQKAVAFGLSVLARFSSESQQLACTTLMEHFTALLAEELLTDTKLQESLDSDVLNLWLWHALEELEHKAVAYDVYELVGNSVEERRRAFLLVAATVLPGILAGWAWLSIRDGQLLHPVKAAEGLNLLLGKEGFVSRILPKMGLFGKRSYHPNDHNTKKLEAKWRRKLFGKNGLMRDTLPTLQ